jgi:hypothetical protein
MPRPKPQPRTTSQRVSDSFATHPITWGALKALALFVVAIGAPIVSVWVWFDSRYEKHVDAEAKFNEVVARITNEATALRMDIVTLKTKAGRDVAWLIVGQVRQEMLATRNRVNDCRGKEADHKLSSGERPACMQYEDELKELQIKFRDVQKAAGDASK